MDLGAIIGTITSGFTGGITGLIGAIGNAFVKYKMLKLQYQHEETLKKLSMEEAKLKTDLQIKLAQAKLQGELQKADVETLKESYKIASRPLFQSEFYDKLPNWAQVIIGLLFAFVETIRAIIRPGLTIFFTILSAWLGYATFQKDPSQFIASTQQLVDTILFITTSIVLWWFGSKDTERFIRERLGAK